MTATPGVPDDHAQELTVAMTRPDTEALRVMLVLDEISVCPEVVGEIATEALLMMIDCVAVFVSVPAVAMHCTVTLPALEPAVSVTPAPLLEDKLASELPLMMDHSYESAVMAVDASSVRAALSVTVFWVWTPSLEGVMVAPPRPRTVTVAVLVIMSLPSCAVAVMVDVPFLSPVTVMTLASTETVATDSSDEAAVTPKPLIPVTELSLRLVAAYVMEAL